MHHEVQLTSEEERLSARSEVSVTPWLVALAREDAEATSRPWDSAERFSASPASYCRKGHKLTWCTGSKADPSKANQSEPRQPEFWSGGHRKDAPATTGRGQLQRSSEAARSCAQAFQGLFEDGFLENPGIWCSWQLCQEGATGAARPSPAPARMPGRPSQNWCFSCGL